MIARKIAEILLVVENWMCVFLTPSGKHNIVGQGQHDLVEIISRSGCIYHQVYNVIDVIGLTRTARVESRHCPGSPGFAAYGPKLIRGLEIK